MLYYTLEKTGFSHKLNANSEFYFADALDTLVSADLCNCIKDNKSGPRNAFIYGIGDRQVVMVVDKVGEGYQVKDISDLGYYAKKLSGLEGKESEDGEANDDSGY